MSSMLYKELRAGAHMHNYSLVHNYAIISIDLDNWTLKAFIQYRYYVWVYTVVIILITTPFVVNVYMHACCSEWHLISVHVINMFCLHKNKLFLCQRYIHSMCNCHLEALYIMLCFLCWLKNIYYFNQHTSLILLHYRYLIRKGSHF